MVDIQDSRDPDGGKSGQPMLKSRGHWRESKLLNDLSDDLESFHDEY